MSYIHYLYDTYIYNEDVLPTWINELKYIQTFSPYSFLLAEHYYRLKSLVYRPQLIIITCSGNSNELDYRLIQSGSIHPQDFFRTFPENFGGALLELMNWRGPCFFIQNAPQNLITGIREALLLTQNLYSEIWVIGCQHIRANEYYTYLCEISQERKSLPYAAHLSEVERDLPDYLSLKGTQTDEQLQAWFEFQFEPSYRFNDYYIRKNETLNISINIEGT